MHVVVMMPKVRPRCFEPMFAAYRSARTPDARSFSRVAGAKVARRCCRRTRASTGAGTARRGFDATPYVRVHSMRSERYASSGVRFKVRFACCQERRAGVRVKSLTAAPR